MKNFKKATILSMVGVLSLLTACGNNTQKNVSDKNNSDSSVMDNKDNLQTEATDKDTTAINFDEEPYTVAIQVVTLPGVENKGEEEREEAINDIILPAINCKVDIQKVWISEITQTTSMAIASDEKMDLIHVATVQPISTMIGSDMLYDMNTDNLLQTHGQDLVNLFGELINSGNVNGKQLAIPAQVFNASAKGFDYNKTIADKYNIEVPEFSTFDDLERVFYKIKEADPSIYPFYVGSGQLNFMQWFYDYESFGSEASYGVVMNPSEDLTVENLFATQEFKDYCLRTYKWKKDGIIPGDPTDTTTAQDYFGAEKLFVGGACNINESQKTSIASKYDFEVGWSEMVAPTITNSNVTEYMWGIATNSERPDKAMDFLNYMYKDPRVCNIIKYGLEGKNYDFAEGSDQIVISNGSYLEQFFIGGNAKDMLVFSPATDNYIEKCEQMENEATVSPLLGYLFDDIDFQTESSVIYSTIMEYLPGLQNGIYSSEDETLKAIDEFNKKLESVGINDVIAANQEQLDTWIASK